MEILDEMGVSELSAIFSLCWRWASLGGTQ